MIIGAPSGHTHSEARDRASSTLAVEPVHSSNSLDTTSVLRAHGPYVWRVLRRLGVAESDVADVCQEVFVVIHRKLGEFEGRSHVRTWVYGICVRTAADYRKRIGRRREVLTDLPPEQAADDDTEKKVAAHQARALLDRVLDDLDDERRAVFVLYEIEQVSMNEVAQVVGCPLQTAYSRLHSARTLVTESIQRLRASKGDRI